MTFKKQKIYIKQLKINKFIFDVKQWKMNKFISNVKMLKMIKFIKSIWQLIVRTSNAMLEVPSLRPWKYEKRNMKCLDNKRKKKKITLFRLP